MTLEEINKISETEKFDILFNNTYFINKILLIKLKKIFSDYFFIPEDQLYTSRTNLKFFIHRLVNKKTIDIDSVKLDLIKNVPITDLCVKYNEPQEVIEEIKNNLYNDIKIINSKIYNLKEISDIFKNKRSTLEFNPELIKIKMKHTDRKCLCWKGSDLNKSLDNITRLTIKGIKTNNSLVPLVSVLDKITNVSTQALEFRIKKGYKVFGVDLSYIHNDRISSKILYIKKEDFDNILKNKKYYIKVGDLLSNKKLEYVYKNNLLHYYNFIYKKSTSLTNMYIKKDTYFKLKEIENLHKNNYATFIDNLCKFIKSENIDSYSTSIIFKLVPYFYKRPKERRDNILTNCNIKILNNKISKKDTLILLKYLK